MMQINPWEVWYAAVRFEDTPEVKLRPVVVTSANEIVVLALKVTTHPPRECWGEYALQQWEAAGLKKQSTVRIGKRLRLEHKDMRDKVGRLHPLDIINIQRFLAEKR